MNCQMTIATMPSTLSSYFNTDLRLYIDETLGKHCIRDRNNVTLYKVQCDQGVVLSGLGNHVDRIVPYLVKH